MEGAFFDPIPAGTRLIETFGWWPGQGVPRFDQHMARLSGSAATFGFTVDRPHIDALVASLCGASALRCRLTLGSGGVADLIYSLLPDAVDRPWKLALAGDRVASTDRWLRHKTTNRQIYDRARAALPEGVDELIFLNERGEVCEGSISNIFVTRADGTRMTPPLSSGCLPGILRGELLASGAVQEGVVSLDALRNARAIHIGNALRGEIACDFTGPFHSI